MEKTSLFLRVWTPALLPKSMAACLLVGMNTETNVRLLSLPSEHGFISISKDEVMLKRIKLHTGWQTVKFLTPVIATKGHWLGQYYVCTDDCEICKISEEAMAIDRRSPFVSETRARHTYSAFAEVDGEKGIFNTNQKNFVDWIVEYDMADEYIILNHDFRIFAREEKAAPGFSYNKIINIDIDEADEPRTKIEQRLMTKRDIPEEVLVKLREDFDEFMVQSTKKILTE